MNKLQNILTQYEASPTEYFSQLEQCALVEIDRYCAELDALAPSSRKELQEASSANDGWRGRHQGVKRKILNGWTELDDSVSYKAADEAKWYQAGQITATLAGLRCIWEVNGDISVKAVNILSEEEVRQLRLKKDNRYVRLEHVNPTSCLRVAMIRQMVNTEVDTSESESFYIRQLMKMNPVCYISPEEDLLLKNAGLHESTPDPLRPWLRYAKVGMIPLALNLQPLVAKGADKGTLRANKGDLESELSKSVPAAKSAGWTFEQWVESILT